jgi:NAD(P)-dependent dehydrogenase (short-subunit alcohol dehydrogenase family)
MDMMSRVAADRGGIDVLVNNASIYAGLEYVDPLEIELNDWDRILEVNLRGVWLCTKHAVPFMRARGGGRIVNQSSIGAWVGAALLHYSVAKAGVNALTTLLAQALGAYDITVNAVAPGQIATPATLDHKAPEAVEAMIHGQSIRRLGTPADLVGAVVYLCSDEASFVTGQVIVIDGGFVHR